MASLQTLLGAEVMQDPEVMSARATVPEDAAYTREGGFDNGIDNVTGLLTLAEAISKRVLGSPAANTVLDCDPTANVTVCQKNLVAKLAPRFYRRPLLDGETAQIQKLMQDIGGTVGVEWALASLIVSPYFHQQLEIEGQPENQKVRITPHEAATRLALRLTGRTPDAELAAAADSGALTTLAQARQQAERLLATDVAHQHLRQEVLNWLTIETVIDPSPIVAQSLGLKETGLGAEAHDELVRFMDHILYTRRGTFRDLMTDKTAFASTDRLAVLYGMPKSDTPNAFSDDRGGILLQSAIVFTARTLPDTIHRGKFVLENLLCQPLPQPPPDAMAKAVDIATSYPATQYSSREILTAQTSGAACAGCHGRMNAIGFALGKLGSLGELRTEEVVYDEMGAVVAKHPLDVAVKDLGFDPGVVTPSNSATDVVTGLAQSATARACAAEQLFAQARLRGATDDDMCLLGEVTQALSTGKPILDVVLASVVNEDLFLRRGYPAP